MVSDFLYMTACMVTCFWKQLLCQIAVLSRPLIISLTVQRLFLRHCLSRSPATKLKMFSLKHTPILLPVQRCLWCAETLLAVSSINLKPTASLMKTFLENVNIQLCARHSVQYMPVYRIFELLVSLTLAVHTESKPL